MLEENSKEEIQPEMIQLIITFQPKENKVHLTGPLQNSILCYGLLEKAKEILLKGSMAAKKIVKPEGDILNFARSLRR